MTGPVAAQILPTAEFNIILTNNCFNNTCEENSTNSFGHCLSQFSLRLNPAPAQDTEVRVLAWTRSGHNRLYDYGVDVYKDDPTDPIRSISTVPITAGNDLYAGVQTLNPICWADDHLVTGDSEVEVVIVGGAGYQVSPDRDRNSFTFTITEDDDCANPGSDTLYMPIGGNMNNTCVCRTRAVAAELYPGSVKQADGQDWDHNLDDYYVTINGNRSLRSSTDRSNYCPESPYQGPGT
ncbi:MAG: hypothetical protein OXF73_01055 [Gammaproteobacteria bacterium]|nr:hypothetical protein [Gammaproteobacteria bacterium]